AWRRRAAEGGSQTEVVSMSRTRSPWPGLLVDVAAAAFVLVTAAVLLFGSSRPSHAGIILRCGHEIENAPPVPGRAKLRVEHAPPARLATAAQGSDDRDCARGGKPLVPGKIGLWSVQLTGPSHAFAVQSSKQRRFTQVVEESGDYVACVVSVTDRNAPEYDGP